MRVREWMTPRPVTVTRDTSVLTARRLLDAYGIRHLPVVHGEEVVGMLSDRDLGLRDGQVAAALSALQSDLLSGRYRRVEALMSTPVRVARADDPIRNAVEDMQRWGVSALPVLHGGQLVGIITSSDCLRALQHLEGREARRPRPASIDLDPELCRMNPMPPGDDRPGRRQRTMA